MLNKTVLWFHEIISPKYQLDLGQDRTLILKRGVAYMEHMISRTGKMVLYQTKGLVRMRSEENDETKSPTWNLKEIDIESTGAI